MFKPLHNRVLVLPDPKTEKTDFGLLLPESKGERPHTGIVIVGNTDVQEGQRILFSLFGIDEITLDNVPHVVVSDKGVIGIYE